MYATTAAGWPLDLCVARCINLGILFVIAFSLFSRAAGAGSDRFPVSTAPFAVTLITY